jgi:hypothetical protein
MPAAVPVDEGAHGPEPAPASCGLSDMAAEWRSSEGCSALRSGQVERSMLDLLKERVPLRAAEGEKGAGRVRAVADGDLGPFEGGHLDAGIASAAVTRLSPGKVLSGDHWFPFTPYP